MAARWGSVLDARKDLDEALCMAELGSYRIYEADSHTALAWMNHRMGGRETAIREVEFAND